MSAECGHLAVTVDLIEAGAKPDAKGCDGSTELYRAVQNEHKEVVEALIKAGTDVNCCLEDGHGRPLRLAAGLGNLKIVADLLRTS
eukprot:g13613.t1